MTSLNNILSHLLTLPKPCLLHSTPAVFMHNKKEKTSPFYVLLCIIFCPRTHISNSPLFYFWSPS